MIKLRLKAFEAGIDHSEWSVIDGENVRDAVERVLVDVPLADRKVEDLFVVVVDGHIIPPNLWGATRLTESSEVLIAPLLSGETEKTIFKLAAVIAVTALAGPFIVGIVGSGVAAGLLTGAVSVATSLLLNALIPPAVPTVDALNPGNSYNDSQMYAVTSQSNQAKKFGSVPKLYGQHRIFPNLAAVPYSELQADASGGNVSYFYAVYDLGFGPMSVSNVMIGDTSIANFTDVEYYLIDPNKPVVSEGEWDDAVRKDFVYYKGVASADSFSYSLNQNELAENAPAGTPTNSDLSTYQVIRNSAVNSDGLSQTITLSLANLQGLYSFDTSGNRLNRTIEWEVYYSKLGQPDNWLPYNNYDNVKDFSVSGGQSEYIQTPLTLVTANDSSTTTYRDVYSNLTGSSGLYYYQSKTGVGSPYYVDPRPSGWYRETYYGIRAGDAWVGVDINAPVNIGDIITCTGQFVGRVADIRSAGSKGGFYKRLYFETNNLTNRDLIHATQRFADEKGLQYLGDYAFTIIGSVNSAVPIYGKGRVSAQTSEPFYTTIQFTPKDIGQFQVRITRKTTYSDAHYQTADQWTLTAITTRFAKNPVATDYRHVFLELRIKATDQLNGSVGNLSAVCQSVLDIYNGTNWYKGYTQNPAWVFADLLTGEVNKRSIPKSRLHLPSLLEWANFCDEVPKAPTGQTYIQPRFRTNFILDYSTTLQQVLGQVANSAQASLNIIDGKYGVLLDKRRNVPVQIFTPRNSRDFSSLRAYTARPDGLTVNYVDPNSDWQTNQVTVYDKGFTKDTAETFDELTSFACTNDEQAWRYGRYMLFQNRLRQETISLTVDFEQLVCTRGDYVQIVQDVMKVGGVAARVKKVNAQTVTLDEALENDPAISYGYVYRSKTGQIRQGTVTKFNLDDELVLQGYIPEVGDLVVIGQTGKIVYDCIVKSLHPNADLSAQLTLVEKADEIYDSESTDIIPDYSPVLTKAVNASITPPGVVQDLVILKNTWRCNGAAYEYYVTVDWDAPATGTAVELYEIYVDSGKGYNLVGTTRDSVYEYIVDPTRLDNQHNFKIVGVSANGNKLDLIGIPVVSTTPVYKRTPPPDVESLNIDITDQVLQLVWPQLPNCDIQEYRIRFTPNLSTPTWATSIPLLRANKNQTLAATQGRVGSYLIKAVDFNGNESANEKIAITTIPSLINLNLIEELNDFPDLGGSTDRVVAGMNQIVLDQEVASSGTTPQYYSEGYYYMKDYIYLDDVYTIRLQSLIEAEGISSGDLMSSWATLSSVARLANAGSTDWDVRTQYRSTDEILPISSWSNLGTVDQLSAVDNTFTPWRDFLVGDATGRFFQFRLKLISNQASVTPRVINGDIRADTPDRNVQFNNVIADATNGFVGVYSPKFKGPLPSPNVQVSIDNAQSGDYWAFDYKTTEGFQVRVFDANGNQVERQIDVSVRGYGRKAVNTI